MSTRSTIRGLKNPKKLARLLDLIPTATPAPAYPRGTGKSTAGGDPL
jgi:hypothetical protein